MAQSKTIRVGQNNKATFGPVESGGSLGRYEDKGMKAKMRAKMRTKTCEVLS